jgi:tricarballylate dehydrogenase
LSTARPLDGGYDVVVVGAGNAAFSAAHAAREQVERVAVLEKAPREWLGGNSTFTAGAFRTTHAGLDDLRPLLHDLPDEEAERIVLPPYTPDDFVADMRRLTHGRCDPTLTSLLAENAAPTLRWLHGKGLRWRLMFERQSFLVDGKRHFWGGLSVGTVGGGAGLTEQHLEAALAAGIDVRVETPVIGLLIDEQGVRGVTCLLDGERVNVPAGAVVIAAGGFQADPLMRAQYLGPGWDVAKLRGTPYNSGEILRSALEIGAQPYGHWSGAHAIAWDAGAPDHGDLVLTNRLSRQGYPVGIVVNADGERFVDEGADFRNYTYARYGAVILAQPGALAYQLFDAKTRGLVSSVDYDHPGATTFEAETVDELATAIGIKPRQLRETVERFNAAVQPGRFNPAVLDGVSTTGIKPPKSNWAQPLDEPPFYAFPVTCGLSFTFGGVRIDEEARVLDARGVPIPGLSAAGELVGGLFYHNYPGGSGLMAGAVFGYRAGRAAARHAAARRSAVTPY